MIRKARQLVGQANYYSAFRPIEPNVKATRSRKMSAFAKDE